MQIEFNTYATKCMCQLVSLAGLFRMHCRQESNPVQSRFSLLSLYSAPKSGRTWIGGGKLNCRGTISPGPLEAVFFGPQSSTNTMKCTGNSNLSSARHLHKEICAILLESLESLKVSLSEFTTVLPQQWVSLMGNGVTTNGDWCGQEQRLKKITEAAKVSYTVVQYRFFILDFLTMPFKPFYRAALGNRGRVHRKG